MHGSYEKPAFLFLESDNSTDRRIQYVRGRVQYWVDQHCVGCVEPSAGISGLITEPSIWQVWARFMEAMQSGDCWGKGA